MQARDAMHAFLGGDVPHSILDDKRLGDDEKLKRRLHALNIMAMEGWKVSLKFWEVISLTSLPGLPMLIQFTWKR